MRLIAAGLLAASLAGGCATAQPAEESASLEWLTGCWVTDDGATREIWSEPYGDLLFGYAVTEQDGAVVFFEDLRIEPTETGADYVASPGGGDPVRFERVAVGPASAAFVNPEHDFPQRIVYVGDGDRLIATISLADGSEARAFGFTRCVERPGFP
ncbi:MAG: DUF6265 family protein [Maricaulaceae bacterium]|jgi:hypothetical protein